MCDKKPDKYAGNRYVWLDQFRLLAAALVVAIHTSPLLTVSESADFFLTRVCARIAVPFFFMVTGQFVAASFLFQNAADSRHEASLTNEEHTALRIRNLDDFGRVWGYVKKIAKLYAAAILLYLPIGFYAGHYEGIDAMQLLRMLCFDGTFYHLWYFPACILGILLVYGCSRVLRLGQVLAVTGMLYVVGMFGDSYYGIAKQVPMLADFYEGCFRIFTYTRNGIFLAPVFLVLGAVAGKRQGTLRIRMLWAALGVSFCAMTAEAFLLRHFEVQRHDSMYVALLPVMYCLYEILLLGERQTETAACWRSMDKCQAQVGMEHSQAQVGMEHSQAQVCMGGGAYRRRWMRTTATWIYILHPAMIVLIRGFAKAVHQTGLLVDHSLIHYLAVLLCSGAAAFAVCYFLSMSGQHPSACGRAWIELDVRALKQNVAYLRACLPQTCKLMPAIKADAYGHGADLIAGELQKLGIDAFCVASVGEGVNLRKRGIKGVILILGYTYPQEFALLHRYRLTQTIVDYDYAVQLNQFGKKIHVHIGIDTGMHRIGERCEHIEKLAQIFEMQNIVIDGMFTHLCVSDSQKPQDQSYTKCQAQAFYQTAHKLQERGYPCPKVHMLASYGILNYPQFAGDYARVGIALYGVLSTKEDTMGIQGHLQPVLSLKARVVTVKELYAGESVGYGLSYTADCDRKIAVLAIGYADGLPRTLSEGIGSVLLHGQVAPVIGRICMDQTIIDISGIRHVEAGDIAVFIGRSGGLEISACDLAQQAGTIANEILSRMGQRLERILV